MNRPSLSQDDVERRIARAPGVVLSSAARDRVAAAVASAAEHAAPVSRDRRRMPLLWSRVAAWQAVAAAVLAAAVGWFAGSSTRGPADTDLAPPTAAVVVVDRPLRGSHGGAGRGTDITRWSVHLRDASVPPS